MNKTKTNRCFLNAVLVRNFNKTARQAVPNIGNVDFQTLELLVSLYKTTLKRKRLSKEAKYRTIRLLQEKFLEAQEDYGMNLDVTLEPEFYWDEQLGTCSLPSEPESDNEDNENREADALVNPNEPHVPVDAIEPAQPTLPAQENENQVSISHDNNKFLKLITDTMLALLNENNIAVDTPPLLRQRYPRFKRTLMKNMVISMDLPSTLLQEWLHTARNAPQAQVQQQQQQ